MCVVLKNIHQKKKKKHVPNNNLNFIFFLKTNIDED